MEGKIVGKKLIHLGYVYIRSGKPVPGKSVYWECPRLKSKSCKARAVTLTHEEGNVVVTKHSDHEHPPDQETCKALEVLTGMKRTPSKLPPL